VSLAGKTLFITGASRGIGLAIALRAGRDGANIAIAAKTETPHPKLAGTIFTAAEEIERAGGRALPLVVDVRDEAMVADALARVRWSCYAKPAGLPLIARQMPVDYGHLVGRDRAAPKLP
jgi:NAD(P)-dependent dehydrogenase (short-subunit alcohol dehydrogenase family)